MSYYELFVLQWLKRLDAGDNATTTYRSHGDLYVLLQTSRDRGSTSMSTTRQRDGSYVSQLTLSQVSARDAGLYACVVTGRYGVRSNRTAVLSVYTGQRRLLICETV